MSESEKVLLTIFAQILEEQKKQTEILEKNLKSTKEIENTSNWFFLFYIILPIICFLLGTIFWITVFSALKNLF